MTLYIITGVTGHVGCTLALKLLARGCAVRGLAGKSSAEMLCGAEIIRGDIRSDDTLKELFSSLDGYDRVCVIHSAAVISMKRNVDDSLRECNVGATERILSVCRSLSLSDIVYVGSVDAYPDTDGVVSEPERIEPSLCRGAYAVTKAEAMLTCLNSELPVKIVCPTAVLGPNDYKRGLQTRMLSLFLRGALPVGVGGGYDFVDCRSVADGILLALDNAIPNRLYTLGGRYAAASELLTLAGKFANIHPPRGKLPKKLVRAGVPLCLAYSHFTHTSPLFSQTALDALFSEKHYSHLRAQSELGFSPIPLEDTVRDTVNFLKNGVSENAGIF